MSPRRARAVRGRDGDDPATALRDLLIDTAERLLAERQVSTITTRDIARAAGVSDGVLYNYFADKHELVVTALIRRYSRLVTAFDTGLPEPGTGEVEQNLVGYATAALDLVAKTLPMAAGLMSEPALLHRFIAEIHKQPFGPQRMREPIAAYLRGEQELGRLRRFDPDPAIALMLGQAIMLGLNLLISGSEREHLDEDVRAVVHVLLHGLLPERPPAG